LPSAPSSAPWRRAGPCSTGFLVGRSRCGACGATLGAGETIPLWSWLGRGDDAGICGAPIGWLPLLAELGGGLIAVLAFSTLPPATALLLTAIGLVAPAPGTDRRGAWPLAGTS
jgi:leader peptidase (prepilin peptidase)/N-methyltransferase